MTTETVTRELRIDNYDAMMEANASLMDEIYNDGKMTAAEKMKSFTAGVRNQAILSRDLAARRKELYSYGMKDGGDIKSLGYNPLENKPAE